MWVCEEPWIRSWWWRWSSLRGRGIHGDSESCRAAAARTSSRGSMSLPPVRTQRSEVIFVTPQQKTGELTIFICKKCFWTNHRSILQLQRCSAIHLPLYWAFVKLASLGALLRMAEVYLTRQPLWIWRWGSLLAASGGHGTEMVRRCEVEWVSSTAAVYETQGDKQQRFSMLRHIWCVT